MPQSEQIQGSYDADSISVLEGVLRSRRPAWFREAARVLRPGGLYVGSTFSKSPSRMGRLTARLAGIRRFDPAEPTPSHQVKLAMAANPHLPSDAALALLPFLTEQELRPARVDRVGSRRVLAAFMGQAVLVVHGRPGRFDERGDRRAGGFRSPTSRRFLPNPSNCCSRSPTYRCASTPRSSRHWKQVWRPTRASHCSTL